MTNSFSFPLLALPPALQTNVMQSLDGPDQDKMQAVNKSLKLAVDSARVKNVREAATKPGRITPEPLPTRLELLAQGIPHPRMSAILETMQDYIVPPGQPGPRGPIQRNMEAHAELQEAEQAARQFGGLARLDTPNGTYVGQFVNGVPDGFGRVTMAATPFRYEGAVFQGNRHGLGFEKFAEGAYFEGQFVDNARHGMGSARFADGGRYAGQWAQGRRTGEGVQHFPNGARYDGSFESNRFHGRGTLVFPNGDRYIGQWVNGSRAGQGTLTLVDGTR